jgi:hypothetical protein
MTCPHAITTEYLSPTATKGARVIARAAGESLTLGWTRERDNYDNHRYTALHLAARLGWAGTYVAGWADLTRFNGMVWVKTLDAPTFTYGGKP